MKKILLASICCFVFSMSFAQSDTYLIDSTICLQFSPEFGALLPSTREVTLASTPSGRIIQRQLDNYSIELGAWVSYRLITDTFDDNENLTLTLIEVWNETNQVFENEIQIVYTLNGEGIAIEVVEQHWNGSMWDNVKRDSYEYESGASAGPTLFLSESWIDGAWVNSFQVLNSYNAQNLLASTFFQTFVDGEWLNGNRSFETYNSDDLIESSVREVWNTDINDWIPSSQVLHTYYGQDSTQILSQQWDNFNEIWFNTTLLTTVYNDDYLRTDELSQVWINEAWGDLFRLRFEYDAVNNLTHFEGDLFNQGNWRPQNACDLYWSLLNPSSVEQITNQIECNFSNPFQVGSSVSCESLDASKSYQLEVLDINGISHLTKKMTETEDVSIHKNLPQGMYVLLIKNEDGLVFRQKLMVL